MMDNLMTITDKLMDQYPVIGGVTMKMSVLMLTIMGTGLMVFNLITTIIMSSLESREEKLASSDRMSSKIKRVMLALWYDLILALLYLGLTVYLMSFISAKGPSSRVIMVLAVAVVAVIGLVANFLANHSMLASSYTAFRTSTCVIMVVKAIGYAAVIAYAGILCLW